MKIYINGRFLTQNTTGVQRVAQEIIKSLDCELLFYKGEPISFEILLPKNQTLKLELKNIKMKKVGHLTGHLWEQLELPFYCKKKLLINFCNTAPALKKEQMVFIHDAAIFSKPEGYSLKFILWYRLLYLFVARFSYKIITVSNFSKGELVRYLPNLKKKISVIPIAANHIDKLKSDESILINNGLDKKDYLFAVSSMHPNKNFKLIINALEQMTSFKGQVVIAGSSNGKVFSKEKYKKNNNIKFIGYVTDEQLKALYKNAKAFIFPSLYEGFGLPPLEAMNMGCPVIVSNAASIPEVCGDAALYFNPNDFQELQNCFNLIYNDETLIKDLKRNGLRRSKKYHWSKTSEELINKIKEVLNENRNYT
ncbi:glycosyltransferase family 4 protein [Fictibacillus sp. BK138]|uniref:glycosyltransferase family 4 protein n=1 Tax=Fictibacillus sp. BK138 TaxID=2512121 RepID=UPI0010F28CD3|nr:glycosyltransferase family 1 protein [Fictibacillus sp. BK138]RZT21377.1 glycosyltransferase involved in cell wall biosynthesis [Fictibacillus sp. BK138]